MTRQLAEALAFRFEGLAKAGLPLPEPHMTTTAGQDAGFLDIEMPEIVARTV